MFGFHEKNVEASTIASARKRKVLTLALVLASRLFCGEIKTFALALVSALVLALLVQTRLWSPQRLRLRAL